MATHLPGQAIEIRRAEDRGRTEIGWLTSRHSFSFGRYYDPRRVSFGLLRVLNDDVVEPGGGFGEHGHDNMEILSWVLEGGLAHADSTGGRGVIRPGELQVMSAGRGIRHSEMNASGTERVHFLQIWIQPSERDIEPTYQQKMFEKEGCRGRWRLAASPDGREGSLRINQDATLRIADVGDGDSLRMSVGEGRLGYAHVAAGRALVGGEMLQGGDAAALTGPTLAEVAGSDGGQVLFFDLPR